ncbi:hypothetical protein AJ79_04104 [Helicocarpus griseus UAMH5409]|uniref:Uncharacterized protein n=1 Tax=Helicocarpus griseus UAMH5409 TaxID=1447875 RepID=A0A2B7XVD5_9EURO|nr:hypothetical protein AJ79_04104 [Helicocarpus griseus UAMH5409]
MAPRTVYLIASRYAPTQRAHFAILFPSAFNKDIGTLINVEGAPMLGYQLEINCKYSPAATTEPHISYPIGQIESQHIDESTENAIESSPTSAVERVASQVPPPGISQNFLAPVNETTNKRCQEWTTEYIRRLADLQYINVSAIQIVQSKRDPPSHGIGLQPVDFIVGD